MRRGLLVLIGVALVAALAMGALASRLTVGNGRGGFEFTPGGVAVVVIAALLVVAALVAFLFWVMGALRERS